MTNSPVYCEWSDLEVEYCAHCREKKAKEEGTSVKYNGLSLDGIKPDDLMAIGMTGGNSRTIHSDPRPEVWIGPDEAYARGKFGKGNHRA